MWEAKKEIIFIYDYFLYLYFKYYIFRKKSIHFALIKVFK